MYTIKYDASFVQVLEKRIAELERKLEFQGAIEAADNALITGLKQELTVLREAMVEIVDNCETLEDVWSVVDAALRWNDVD